MGDKNIGMGSEKDVVIGSETQAIADVKARQQHLLLFMQIADVFMDKNSFAIF